MSILPLLVDNKGTISSALGESLAKEALLGDAAILEEAAELLAHEDRNVRAGAAKIVEQVAVADPSLVLGHLPPWIYPSRRRGGRRSTLWGCALP